MNGDFVKVLALISTLSLVLGLVFVSVQWKQSDRELSRTRSTLVLHDRAMRVVVARQIVQASEIQSVQGLSVATARAELQRQNTLNAVMNIDAGQNRAVGLIARRVGLIP